jgi:Domain of unknown function (DUF5134)
VSWVSGGLALVCLAVTLLHVARLVLHARAFGDDPGGPVGEVSHAAMALGMAAMFSPLGDPLPGPVWAVLFVLCGGWFAAVAVRTRSIGGDAAHHVVGSAAMLFMLLTHHNDADMEAMPGMHHAAGGGLGPVPLVAIVLAGYFGWHALRCSDALRVEGPVEPEGSRGAVVQRVGVLRSAQTVAVAHVVMAVAMTVMLLAMI